VIGVDKRCSVDPGISSVDFREEFSSEQVNPIKNELLPPTVPISPNLASGLPAEHQDQ
jgi:hypothetical protein